MGIYDNDAGFEKWKQQNASGLYQVNKKTGIPLFTWQGDSTGADFQAPHASPKTLEDAYTLSKSPDWGRIGYPQKDGGIFGVDTVLNAVGGGILGAGASLTAGQLFNGLSGIFGGENSVGLDSGNFGSQGDFNFTNGADFGAENMFSPETGAFPTSEYGQGMGTPIDGGSINFNNSLDFGPGGIENAANNFANADWSSIPSYETPNWDFGNNTPNNWGGLDSGAGSAQWGAPVENMLPSQIQGALNDPMSILKSILGGRGSPLGTGLNAVLNFIGKAQNKKALEKQIAALSGGNDVFSTRRKEQQDLLSRMTNDPNFLNNDAVLKSMMDRSLNETRAKMASQGYSNSGNMGHELMKTGTDTMAQYFLPYRDQALTGAGGKFPPQNNSQAIAALTMANQGNNVDMNNMLGWLFGSGEDVAKSKTPDLSALLTYLRGA